jgi:hypothetical protein
LDAVPELVAEALRRGWLRPPIDGELLARARAEAVELRDRIRRRRRQERAAAQSTSPSVLESHVRSSSVSVGDMSAEQEDGDR